MIVINSSAFSMRRRVLVTGFLGLSFVAGQAITAPAFAQQNELKVALVAPMSGSMARQGELMKLGAQMAIEDINAQGGIAALNGAKLKLVIEDAGDRAETAKNAAQRLVANEPDVIAGLGSWSSSLTLAVTEVTERAHLPWITLSYADQLTGRGFKYIVQTTPIASKLALDSMPTVLNMAQSVSGKRPATLAIVSDSTAASQAFVKPLREGGADKIGLKIVTDEVFTPPLSDATSIVQKLRSTSPDVLLFYATGFPDAKLVLSKMGEFGLSSRIPVVSVGVQFVSPEMLAAVGADALQGHINIAGNWSSKLQDKIIPDLIKRSREPWIGQDTMSTYGDIWLLKDALERAHSADHDKVMAALHATDRSDGPASFYLGDRIAFDADGRRLGGSVGLIQWQGGVPYLIWPQNAATKTPLWLKK
jgi:branched-chain amino acid transport system substrate-binding protein